MNTIKVNVQVLEEKIQKLQDLKTQCDSIVVAKKDVQGAGQSVNSLRRVDEEYAEIKDKMQMLLENSIVFFTNVKNSVVAADSSAATKLN